MNRWNNIKKEWITFWRKKLKRKGAKIAFIYLAISLFLTILGSFVRPDSTPYANTMHYSIAKQNPGFTVKILKVRKNLVNQSYSFWNRLFLGGQTSAFIEIPIKSYQLIQNQVICELHNAHGTDNLKAFSLLDIVYPISRNQEVELINNTLKFRDINGTDIQISTEDLVEQFKRNHIENRTFILGTDHLGRDFLSRLMAGGVVSLSVGSITMIISLILGVLFGSISAYYGGWVDAIIGWVIQVFWSIPTLLLVIAIVMSTSKSFSTIFWAIGLTMWIDIARLVRTQILTLKQKPFVLAARSLGYSNFRIIWHHMLPNLYKTLIVAGVAVFSGAILLEAGLSFLGIGTEAPIPSWGGMIAQYKNEINTAKAYMVIIPGVLIANLVLALMTLANEIRRNSIDGKNEEAKLTA